jgi:TPR repeat protein
MTTTFANAMEESLAQHAEVEAYRKMIGAGHECRIRIDKEKGNTIYLVFYPPEYFSEQEKPPVSIIPSTQEELCWRIWKKKLKGTTSQELETSPSDQALPTKEKENLSTPVSSSSSSGVESHTKENETPDPALSSSPQAPMPTPEKDIVQPTPQAPPNSNLKARAPEKDIPKDKANPVPEGSSSSPTAASSDKDKDLKMKMMAEKALLFVQSGFGSIKEDYTFSEVGSNGEWYEIEFEPIVSHRNKRIVLRISARALLKWKAKPPVVATDQVVEKEDKQMIFDKLEQAQELWDQNQKEKAVEIYQECGQDPQALFRQGVYWARPKYWAKKKKEVKKEKAFDFFVNAAKQGHLNAIYRVGKCFAEGFGIQKDEKLAAQWFQKAALQGHPMAQYRYAQCNPTKYVTWLTHAALNQEASAQIELGKLLLENKLKNSKDTKENDEQAFKWFRRAADKNKAEAYFQMGLCYQSGRGITQDFTLALESFTQASKLKFPAAYCRLGRFFDSCYSKEGPEYLWKDDKAYEWYEKCVTHGDRCKICLYNLSIKFRNTDRVKCLDLTREAASKGFAGAQYQLAIWYHHGSEKMKLECDLPKACQYYKLASLNGHDGAMTVWPPNTPPI